MPLLSHQLRPGESIAFSLAYGVPMSTIAAANGIVNYNLITLQADTVIP
jgi:hypothetical protein